MRPSIRSRLVVLVRGQWAGLLALFLVIAGGTAYAADTIGSSDIIDESILSQDVKNGEVKTTDIGNNQVQSVDVKDGQLNDEDVGQAAFVDFEATIGSVNAQTCKFLPITGIGAEKDHLLLTSRSSDTHPSLIYAVQYSPDSGGAAVLEACNPTAFPANDGNSHFSLLLIDGD